jgi:hypothetical protein
MFVVFVGTEITEATGIYCATSNKLYFAHVWITVISALTSGLAIMSVLRFYKSVKSRVEHRKPMAKLIAFKGIIFLTFLQNVRLRPPTPRTINPFPILSNIPTHR